MLVGEATLLKGRELVSAEVMPVPGAFGVDPVRVNSVPGVVDLRRTGCVSYQGAVGKKKKKM